MPRLLPLLLLTLLIVAGCGYRPEGLLAETRSAEQPRLAIELLINRTGRAFLENDLSNNLVQRFSRGGLYRLVEGSDNPDLLMGGLVRSYEAVAAAYDHLDRIRLYRASLSVEVVLTQVADGRVLWKGTVTETTEYAADDDRARQQTNENRAIVFLAERIADEVYARIATDF